jgi:type IV secretion system protein VirB1
MDMALETQIEHCVPAMKRSLMTALVRRESNGNPFAIGMDGGETPVTQPKSLADAVATAEKLDRMGRGFSVGLAQIHISNIRLLGLPWVQAFDGCTNLRHGQRIFENFHSRALGAGFKNDGAVFAALRGYNSGSVFAPVSNKYAAAIMADAAKTAPPLRGEPAMVAFSTASEEDNSSESKELFSK